MVELKLDTADAEIYGKDHYISVRVGDCQKLAKMLPSRTYKFPSKTAKERKYGKVEVFRRVGQAIVCVDPEVAMGSNVVEVKMDGDGDAKISFQAGVSEPDVATSSASPKAKRKEAASQPSSPKSATQNAAAYLELHHLEVRLADAMQAVLRERPSDPAAFLAHTLLKNADLTSNLPKVLETAEPQIAAEEQMAMPPAPPPPLPMVAAEAEEETAKCAPPVSTEQSVKAAPAPELVPVTSASAPYEPQAFLPSSGSFGGCGGKFGGMIAFKPQAVAGPAAVATPTAAPGAIAAAVPAAPAIEFATPAAVSPPPFEALRDDTGFMMSNVQSLGPGFWNTGMSVGFLF